MFKVISALVLSLFAAATCYAGPQFKPDTFTADKDRTLYLRGEVAENAMMLAAQVYQLASESSRPISLVINSPGGSIYAGLQLMSAIRVAQVRGVTVRCMVPVLAASMAFQILSVCDERYVFRYTLLLFHPARSLMRGAFLADELAYNADELRKLDTKLKKDLAARLEMDPKVFNYHYKHETLWLAEDLNAQTDDFFTVVENIVGVEKPFHLED